MEDTFNYKQILEHPITLFRFGKFTLPFGVSLIRIILFITIFLLMLVFHRFVNTLVFVPGLQVAVYLGIPFLLSSLFLKFKQDGKKLHRFITDFSSYLFQIYLPKQKYCNDRKVLYANEKITFEPVKMKKGGHRHETQNADETNIQQPHAHKHRRHMGILPGHAGGHSSVK